MLRTKNTIIAIVLLVLTAVVQLIPFVNTTSLNSETEDFGKTWAQLPVGITGKDRSAWPPEIKYGEFDSWEKEIQEKYPLYGEKNVSIFTYIWNPAGALTGNQVNAFILIQIMFIAFGLFSFIVKNFTAKGIISILFGISQIYGFAKIMMLKAEELMAPFMVTSVLVLVMGLITLVLGVLQFIEGRKIHAEEEAEKARRYEEIKKSFVN